MQPKLSPQSPFTELSGVITLTSKPEKYSYKKLCKISTTNKISTLGSNIFMLNFNEKRNYIMTLATYKRHHMVKM